MICLTKLRSSSCSCRKGGGSIAGGDRRRKPVQRPRSSAIAAKASVRPTVTEIDRTSFDIITGHPRYLALSRSRRSVRGGLQAASPLWPKEEEVELARLRVPAHCFSEADRLLSRPADALADPRVSRSRASWRAALRGELDAFDGLVPPNHPVILRALAPPECVGVSQVRPYSPRSDQAAFGLDATVLS